MYDDALAYRETETAHEAFEREVEDTAEELYPVQSVDENGVWKDPRIGEVEHCDGFDRYTITADASAMDDVLKAVHKLNVMVKRHGGEVRIVAQEPKRLPHPWMKQRVRNQDGHGFSYVPKIMDMVLCTIEAPAVAGESAKLVGAFELAEDGVSVYANTTPDFTAADMEPFKPRWWECDHCGYNRQRHASFVCEKADGTRTLIGRQCSMAYLGLSPTELLARAAAAKVLSGAGEGEEGFFGGGSSDLHVASVMERAYRVAKHFHGYSRLIRDDFLEHMMALRGAKDEKGSYTYANIRAMYAEKPALEPMDLNAFADWLADGQAKGDDFITNLYVAFSSEYVKPKRFNLIVAGVGIFVGRAIKAAEQARLDKMARETQPALKHADAKEGERFGFVGTVIRTSPYSNDFGGGLVIVTRGDDGTNVLNFTSSRDVPSRGDRVYVKATVKRHQTDNKSGDPVTVVSRAVYKKQEDAQ